MNIFASLYIRTYAFESAYIHVYVNADTVYSKYAGSWTLLCFFAVFWHCFHCPFIWNANHFTNQNKFSNIADVWRHIFIFIFRFVSSHSSVWTNAEFHLNSFLLSLVFAELMTCSSDWSSVVLEFTQTKSKIIFKARLLGFQAQFKRNVTIP